MANSDVDSATISHVAAMPFHGWGHINPMMNLCKLLASKNPQLLITFVVTEEWLGFISSDPKPDNIWLASISNVIPPKRLKATNFPGFYEAVMTKMEAPFERLLDRLEPPVSAIIADIEVPWGVRFGIRRNIPVSLFWTMSTTFLSMLQHFNVFSQNKNIPLEFFDCGDQIPGISSTDLADLGEMFKGNDPKVMKLALECISWVPKAQYLLFTFVYELEPQIFDSLQAEFPFHVYPIGPAIPYLELEHNCSASAADNAIDYLKWLDSQSKGSVLYILKTELDYSITNPCGIDLALTHVILPNGVHLRVSQVEDAAESILMQLNRRNTNSRQIVEEWKIGRRVKTEVQDEKLTTREEIAELVKRFMDLSSDGKEMRKRAKEMRKRAKEHSDLCHRAIAKGGSYDTNLDNFIRDIGKAATF